MRALIVRAVLASVLVPAGSGAQTLLLTEAEALAQLESDSARVRAARAGIDVARADALGAARWPNPRVTANREAAGGVTEHIVTVAQVLPVTGRRALQVQAASARVDAVASRAEEQIRRVRADLRLAFTDLWSAQVREEELGRSAERVRALVALLGRREAEGESAGFDRLRADRELVEIETDRALAAADATRARAVLAGFFTEAPPGPVQAVRRPAAAMPLPAVEDLMAHAEQTRGDLRAVRHDLEAAALSARAATRLTIPEPEVVGGTKASSGGGGAVGGVIGVQLSVPLFDRAAPERAAAAARGSQVRAEAEALRRVVWAQIAAWRATVIERRAIAERYRAAAVGNAAEIERIAQVSYDAGEHGLLDLLDALRTATAARVRHAALEAAVRQAEVELAFASGWEIP